MENFGPLLPCAVMAGIGPATSVLAAHSAKNCDMISCSLHLTFTKWSLITSVFSSSNSKYSFLFFPSRQSEFTLTLAVFIKENTDLQGINYHYLG